MAYDMIEWSSRTRKEFGVRKDPNLGNTTEDRNLDEAKWKHMKRKQTQSLRVCDISLVAADRRVVSKVWETNHEKVMIFFLDLIGSPRQ